MWSTALLLIPFALATAGAPQATPTSRQAPPASAEPAPAADSAVTSPPRCVRQTGTHIRHRAAPTRRSDCGAGRSYSREELDRAGAAVDLADALRRLDPSIQ